MPLKFAFVVIQKSIYHVRLPISIIIVSEHAVLMPFTKSYQN